MRLFDIRKPRAFRHRYMFADERKDKLKAIEDRAKAELGLCRAKSGGREEIRGMFLRSTRYARRRHERRQAGGFVMSYGAILVLLILLVALWKLLLVL